MTDMGIDTSASVAVSALPLASPAGAGTGSPSMWLGWHLLGWMIRRVGETFILLLFMLCYPRSKPIHHATLDPRNQKSCCLSAVSHRAHLLRGYFAAPESASIFHPKITQCGSYTATLRISDPNMFTQEVCNHSLRVEFFK